MSRKILYSPGYGAGWTTWNNRDVARIMLTYQPIIDFLEAGGKFTDEDARFVRDEIHPRHPILRRLSEECHSKCGVDYVSLLGAADLAVLEVDGRVRIHDYDGYESVEVEGEFDEWM